MRLRIKFTKTGQLKYIGHLDVMRYFQKVLRRADVDVIFSEGFSPHMIMSFALPLGVGLTSVGEYFDVDVKDDYDYINLVQRLNEHVSKDMCVLNVVQVSDKKADKCMTVVDAADYRIDFGNQDTASGFADGFESFVSQERIMTMKKTKSGEKLTDIRPFIYSCEKRDESSFVLKLAAGSRAHLNPQLLADTYMEKFSAENEMAARSSADTRPDQNVSCSGPAIARLDMFTREGGLFIPLDRCSGVVK